MSNPVPVQIEVCTVEDANGRPRNGVCGTCTKCGAHAECALPDGDGPVTAREKAIAKVLATLTKGCQNPLPWGVAPVHADRGIPKGVTLFLRAWDGSLWPATVNEKGKLEMVAGGVGLTTEVLVVPESMECGGSAMDFAAELVKRGYVKAKTAPAGTGKKPEDEGTKTKGETSKGAKK